MTDKKMPKLSDHMSDEWRAKWVAALRSGEFVQGQEMLQPEPGCYCCLGVLNELDCRENDCDPANAPNWPARDEDEIDLDFKAFPSLIQSLLTSLNDGMEYPSMTNRSQLKEYGLMAHPKPVAMGRVSFKVLADLIENNDTLAEFVTTYNDMVNAFDRSPR